MEIKIQRRTIQISNQPARRRVDGLKPFGETPPTPREKVAPLSEKRGSLQPFTNFHFRKPKPEKILSIHILPDSG
jgi:hypothetical protein